MQERLDEAVEESKIFQEQKDTIKNELETFK